MKLGDSSENTNAINDGNRNAARSLLDPRTYSLSELKFSEKVAKPRSPHNVISRFVCFQRFTASRAILKSVRVVVRTGVGSIGSIGSVGSVGFAAALALRRILCLICLVMFHPNYSYFPVIRCSLWRGRSVAVAAEFSNAERLGVQLKR